MTRILRIYLADRRRRGLCLLALIVASIGPTAAMVLLALAIGDMAHGEVRYTLLAFFLVIATVGAVGLLSITSQNARIFEYHIDELRRAIEFKASTIDLVELEQIGPERIAHTLGIDLQEASTTSRRLPSIIVSYVTLGLSLAVILLIAPLVLAIFVAVFGAVVIAILASQRQVNSALRAARARSEVHFGLVGQMLDGAKELRLNAKRWVRFTHDFLVPGAALLRDAKIEEGTKSAGVVFVLHLASWISLFLIVVLLPLYVDDTARVLQALYVAIFIRTYLFQVTYEWHSLTRLTVALNRIEKLIDDLGPEKKIETQESDPLSFSEIVIRDLTFAYEEEQNGGFVIGPVSLSIRHGETIFLTGANGSGKSTFLRMLTRLYTPSKGTITVDGTSIDDRNVDRYRALFSAVFTDFHLFDRLYGLEEIDDDQANALLKDLGLQDRVQVKDGGFTTLKLSSGQRQRLALAVALLEDRPILVLDEVAADQDPAFRARIYQELLPELRRQGKTLIVVSHDDRYFSNADRIALFDEGSVRESREQSRRDEDDG